VNLYLKGLILINNIKNKADLILNYLILLFSLTITFHFINKYIVILMFIVWLLVLPSKKLIFFFKKSFLFQMFLIFSIMLLLPYLWTEKFENNFFYGSFSSYGLNYIYSFFLPIIIISTSIKKEFINKNINMFILSIIVSCILSLCIFLEIFSIDYSHTSQPLNPIPFQLTHIQYSLFLAVGSFLMLYKVIFNKLSLFYISLFLFIVYILFLTEGRTGQYPFILIMLLYIIIYFKDKIKLMIIFLVIFFTTLIFIYNISESFKYKFDTTVNNIKNVFIDRNFTSSIGVRIGSYYVFSSIVEKDNMIFGVGMSNKENYVAIKSKQYFPYRVSNYDELGRLENVYLEMIISNGLFGILILILFYGSIFKLKLKDKNMIYIKYTTFLFLILSGLAVDIWSFFSIKILFGYFIGLLLASNYYYREVKNEKI